jgi:5-amino-6-(5-phosphoribosylamino)uracil reductase/diaminohydroxyphosphoribosylaminopyrimidine deaminase/5-amino-6-(5-phosphoribosylamino)uracil reductase
LPSVTVHYAQSLDGRIATRTGDSRWISGDESLVYAHELRATHDAILVGIGTVLRDNPKLSVRHVLGRDPLRVIVDSRLRTPQSSAVLSDGAAAGTLLCTTEQAPAERRQTLQSMGALVEILDVDPSGRVNLRHLLRRLAEAGVRSVLVEGGSGIITSFLRDSLVDRLVVCVAPKILGSGVEAVGDLHVRHLEHALTFLDFQVQRVGNDLIFDGSLTDRALSAPPAAWSLHTHSG